MDYRGGGQLASLITCWVSLDAAWLARYFLSRDTRKNRHGHVAGMTRGGWATEAGPPARFDWLAPLQWMPLIGRRSIVGRVSYCVSEALGNLCRKLQLAAIIINLVVVQKRWREAERQSTGSIAIAEQQLVVQLTACVPCLLGVILL